MSDANATRHPSVHLRKGDCAAVALADAAWGAAALPVMSAHGVGKVGGGCPALQMPLLTKPQEGP